MERIENNVSLREWMQQKSNFLLSQGIENPESEIYYWLCFVSKQNKAHFMAALQTDVRNLFSVEQIEYLESIVHRRGQRQPLSYILGQADFWRYSFMVEPGVLIPRFDSEILVEKVLEWIDLESGFLSSSTFPLLSYWDLCTGSGCLGISIALELLAKALPFQGILTDIDPVACKVAGKNLEKYQLEEVLSVEQMDLWPISFADSNQPRLDFIVANPPYIPWKEQEDLMPEVRDYEPEIALFAQEEGLTFYDRILPGAFEVLKPNGKVFLEHGYNQQHRIMQMAKKIGFQQIVGYQDYGGNDRLIVIGK